MRSAIRSSELRKRSQRKRIFENYVPKANSCLIVNVKDKDGSRLFPIHKPAPPKSLVHYIDLAPHRKKRMFGDNSISKPGLSSDIKKREEEELEVG